MFIRRDEDDIDRIFRQRLKNAEEPFPGHLWEGVRQRSSRRRRIPPFWIVAAIMLTGALGFGLYQADSTSAPLAQQETTLPVITTPKEGTTSSPNGQITQADPILPSGEITEQQTPPGSSRALMDNNPQVTGRGKSKAVAEGARMDEHAISENTARHQPEPNGAGEMTAEKTGTGLTQHQMDEQLSDSQYELTATPMMLSEPHSIVETSTSPVSSGETPSNINEDLTSAPQPTTETEMAVETPAPIAESPVESSTEPENTDFKLPTPPAASVSPFSIGIYASGFQAHRQMMGNPDMGGSNYLSQDSTALTLSDGKAQGMAFGVGVQYSMSRWVYFSAGLEYSRMKEHTHYRDIYLVGTPTYINQLDTSWLYTPTDTSVNIEMATVPADSIWHTNSKTAMIFNTYQSFNIPLAAGLSLKRDRLFVGLEAGPVFRLGRMYTGKFRYDDHLIPNESSLADSPFAVPQIQEGRSIMLQEVYSKWNVDWHAAVKLGYSITPRLSAQAGVQYRIMQKNIQHADTGDHRIVMPGVSLGLYYRF